MTTQEMLPAESSKAGILALAVVGETSSFLILAQPCVAPRYDPSSSPSRSLGQAYGSPFRLDHQTAQQPLRVPAL